MDHVLSGLISKWTDIKSEIGFLKSKIQEMENIVEELKGLKLKRDRNELRKEDSLRIEYLYSQYQKLKNGGSTESNWIYKITTQWKK